MKRMKYVVVFLLLLMSCKQYDEEVVEKNEKSIKNKSVEEGLGEKVETNKTPEETLREKLNEKQKKGLDFLKEALGDEGKLNNLLRLEEGKVKTALEHIQKQLGSCTGDNASNGKETFKALVKGYFENGNTDLDSFKSQAESTCDANGSGS
ncbi:hypothetical protein DB313_04790 (plasmid) [Borrelia turcica IST7]|uniref:Mlp family lipoprotein n=1 Tax=Borrelia turcica IST7 TaxID=1104446 RepID=A0A386PP59_9SPIR|nr:Mlp family lipoprotein [Borrelia turcica]AYE36819.1 hypothetical protein DB313_04790 [Borrelia turcica IST7]